MDNLKIVQVKEINNKGHRFFIVEEELKGGEEFLIRIKPGMVTSVTKEEIQLLFTITNE